MYLFPDYVRSFTIPVAAWERPGAPEMNGFLMNRLAERKVRYRNGCEVPRPQQPNVGGIPLTREHRLYIIITY